MILPTVVHPSNQPIMPSDFTTRIPASCGSYDTKVRHSNSIAPTIQAAYSPVSIRRSAITCNRWRSYLAGRGLLKPTSYSAWYPRTISAFRGVRGSRGQAENRKGKVSWTAVIPAVLLGVEGGATTSDQRAHVAFGLGCAGKRFSDDTFPVVVAAQHAAPAVTWRGSLYCQAAELTLQHKCRYFAVIRPPRPLFEYRIVYRRREEDVRHSGRRRTALALDPGLRMLLLDDNVLRRSVSTR